MVLKCLGVIKNINYHHTASGVCREKAICNLVVPFPVAERLQTHLFVVLGAALTSRLQDPNTWTQVISSLYWISLTSVFLHHLILSTAVGLTSVKTALHVCLPYLKA